MDTGSKHIGSAAVANGQVVYQTQIEIRNDVSGKMEQRAMYRRTRRSRKTRYRPARFDNRGKVGKIAPSIKSKVDSHLREKKFVESILPISEWKVELASFDIHKISNPSVSKLQSVKLHVHHIKFRSQGGSDTPGNLITLCEDCHDSLHAGKLGDRVHEKLTKKTASKTKHATEMGIVKSQLKKSEWVFTETFGYETKFKRETCLNLPKTHFFDAIAICLGEGEIVNGSSFVYLKRHIANGDFQQTSGRRSEEKIPTGKIQGFKKFDKVLWEGKEFFIKGRMSTGYAILMGIDNKKVTLKPIPKFLFMKRLTARKSCLSMSRGLENS